MFHRPVLEIPENPELIFENGQLDRNNAGSRGFEPRFKAPEALVISKLHYEPSVVAIGELVIILYCHRPLSSR